MSITTTTISLIPIRRDGQISSSNSIGGSGGGFGSTPFNPTPVYTYIDGEIRRQSNNLITLSGNTRTYIDNTNYNTNDKISRVSGQTATNTSDLATETTNRRSDVCTVTADIVYNSCRITTTSCDLATETTNRRGDICTVTGDLNTETTNRQYCNTVHNTALSNAATATATVSGDLATETTNRQYCNTVHNTNIANAATTSTWGGVSGTGKPADNAQVNTINANDGLSALDSGANTKLGTIECGATFGATWNNNIYSQPTNLSGINCAEGGKLTSVACGAQVNTINAGSGLAALDSGASTKLSGIACNATQGATWGCNIMNIPEVLTAPNGSGLFIGNCAMGYYNMGVWNNCIDCTGAAKFGGVTEFGTTPSTINGYSSNVSIMGPDIWENSYPGSNSTLYINRKGYCGSNSYYRQLIIGDGGGNTIATMGGASAGNFVTFWGSQVGIGGVASTSAILQLTSTTKALLLTRMTKTQANAITSKVAGMIAWITGTAAGDQLCFYNGTSWQVLSVWGAI